MRVENLIAVENSKLDASVKRLRKTLAIAMRKERSEARVEVLRELDKRISKLIGRDRLNS